MKRIVPSQETDRILHLSSKELKETVLLTLGDYGKSIKKENLPGAVIRYLKADIRRSNRERFAKRIFLTLERLKLDKQVKEYKAKNVRIKLRKVLNTKRIAPRKSQPQQTLFDSALGNEVPEKDKFEEDNDEDREISKILDRKIPDLAAAIDESDSAQAASGIEGDETPEIDTDEDDLLSAFLGEKETIKDKNQNKDILQYLKAYYEKLEGIRVSGNLNELKLRVTTTSGSIDLTLRLVAYRNELIAASFLPYLEAAAPSILRLLSSIDVIGTLCIEEINRKESFSIKVIIDITKYTGKEIGSIVDQLISESRKIEEAIDKSL